MEFNASTKKGPQTVMVPPDLGAAIVTYRITQNLATNGDAIRRAFECLAQKEGLDLTKLTREAGFIDEFRGMVEFR